MKTQKKPKTSPCKGLTLVELLVVIAVIAVLAALAFPSLRKARDRALEAKAVGQLKQLAPLFFAYAGDNNGALPWGVYHNGGGSHGWDYYMMEQGIATKDEIRSLVQSPVQRDILEDRRSYSMIRARGQGVGAGVYKPGGDPDNPPPDKRVRLATIANASQTLLMAERFAEGSRIGGYAFGVMDFPQEALNLRPDRERMNFLFVDGHAEHLHALETVGEEGTLSNPKGFWTIDPND